jgi:hypothetical protein
MTVFAAAAGLVGCSTSHGASPSRDAGGDGRTGVDARADHRSPPDTGSRDAGPKDVRAPDASSGGARSKDAAGRDVATREASLPDTGARDARLADAPARDVTPGEGGTHDAASPDASDSGTDGTAPTATLISISPLTLTPPFSTAVHDYYVRCVAGTNTLTVTMTAAPGSTIALQQPTTTPASTAQTTTVAVAENEAVVVGVTTSGVTDPYWVRCLPHDFPTLQMTPHPEAGTPTPGYYLVGNLTVAPGDQGYAVVLDGNGVPVWYHTTVTRGGAVDVENLVPGTISYVADLGPTFGDVTGQFELHDLDAGTTTYVEPSGSPLNEHELRALPNGDYLVFASPIATGVDLTGLDSYGPDADVIGCDIQEVDPTGAEVWLWTGTDHFGAVQDSVWPEAMNIDGTTVVDAFHCNSIDVAPNGDLLVSARQMDSVFMVSRSTGAVLWKMGGATYTVEGAPYITVENDPMTSFRGQHDARLLPEGGVSLFDDQTGTAGPARGVIYSVDVDAGTATMVWQYVGKGTSSAMGSFRVQADGSRVIGWGLNQDGDLAFTELGPDGADLLDFRFPDGTQSYRAIKIPTSAFDIDLLRATAGAD